MSRPTPTRRSADILLDTLIFTFGSAAVATLLALFLAYMNTRTDLPFKFFFGVISIIPMMIPHILFAVSWVLLLNPSNGILNRYLMELFGLKEAFFNIYSLPGMILVEGLLDLPDRLPDHRAGHERLRRLARGILQGLRGVHPAHARPGDAAGAAARHIWPP